MNQNTEHTKASLSLLISNDWKHYPEKSVEMACQRILNLVSIGAFDNTLQTPKELYSLIKPGIGEACFWQAIGYVTGSRVKLLEMEFRYGKPGEDFKVENWQIREAERLGVFIYEQRQIADVEFGKNITVYLTKNGDCPV